eukprot:g9673.t1
MQLGDKPDLQRGIHFHNNSELSRSNSKRVFHLLAGKPVCTARHEVCAQRDTRGFDSVNTEEGLLARSGSGDGQNIKRSSRVD